MAGLRYLDDLLQASLRNMPTNRLDVGARRFMTDSRESVLSFMTDPNANIDDFMTANAGDLSTAARRQVRAVVSNIKDTNTRVATALEDFPGGTLDEMTAHLQSKTYILGQSLAKQLEDNPQYYARIHESSTGLRTTPTPNPEPEVKPEPEAKPDTDAELRLEETRARTAEAQARKAEAEARTADGGRGQNGTRAANNPSGSNWDDKSLIGKGWSAFVSLHTGGFIRKIPEMTKYVFGKANDIPGLSAVTRPITRIAGGTDAVLSTFPLNLVTTPIKKFASIGATVGSVLWGATSLTGFASGALPEDSTAGQWTSTVESVLKGGSNATLLVADGVLTTALPDGAQGPYQFTKDYVLSPIGTGASYLYNSVAPVTRFEGQLFKPGIEAVLDKYGPKDPVVTARNAEFVKMDEALKAVNDGIRGDSALSQGEIDARTCLNTVFNDGAQEMLKAGVSAEFQTTAGVYDFTQLTSQVDENNVTFPDRIRDCIKPPGTTRATFQDVASSLTPAQQALVLPDVQKITGFEYKLPGT